ncbi:ECF transporter S component [Corynebacterium kutscheri]|uniref:ECF transporter S component n=1 Tax=Corynebacterium kutscheri TaxID=35755 RepID=UPI000F82DE35|nr:ECF transporter S component [Corynebacterium kutscheri]
MHNVYSSASTSVKNTRWRVIDIVIASVIGVAMGLIFWIWNSIGYAWYSAADALTPGLGGMANGVWLMAGVVGGLIICKPGAAIYVELLAACISAGIGNQWGIETVYYGLIQGLGAEAIFAIFLYRRFDALVAGIAGLGAGVAGFLLELVTSGNMAKSLAFNLIYLAASALSGIVIAGIVSFLLVKALAKTGALDRFAAGREHTELI